MGLARFKFVVLAIVLMSARSSRHNATFRFNANSPDAACIRPTLNQRDTKLLNRKHPGQSLPSPLGIIHIPKTGGTALHSLTCPDLRCHGHLGDAHFWGELGLDSIAFIRDPIQRFISFFLYMKIGAQVGEIEVSGSPLYRAFGDVHDFLDSLMDAKAHKHGRAVALFNKGFDYRRQVDFLASHHRSQVYVACYSKEIAPTLARVFKAIGSNCSSAMQRVRRTGARRTGGLVDGTSHFVEIDDSSKSPAILSQAATAWLMAHYADDIALYANVCEQAHARGTSLLRADVPPFNHSRLGSTALRSLSRESSKLVQLR
jgi:hypothetical protein